MDKKPSKGRNLSIEEKIDIATKVCEMYATDRYTMLACLQANGIQSEGTWFKWRQEIEEIETLYNNAIHEKQSTYKNSLIERASTTLEKFLEGWTVKVTEREGELQKDGSIKTTVVKEKEIYNKPSLGAVIFVLTNLNGKTFAKNPEPYKAGNESIPTKIEFEILGGSVPPVTSEDDIQDIPTPGSSR